jgi:branched-chain amino acid transport system permease protein
MSAARWRRAMTAGGSDPIAARPPSSPRRAVQVVSGQQDPYADSQAPRWLKFLWRHIEVRHTFILAFVLIYPFVVSPFFAFQIGGQALALGMIALSLSFLAGYGGMVSLAQMTVAGVAGYSVAIFGTSATPISLGWPWWLVVPMAVFVATIFSIAVGWLSVRTEGIYTIMITLAMGVAFYYLALQNYSVFNGFQGFQKLYAPEVFGVNWQQPVPFYFLALAVSMSGYFWIKWLVRTPFGLSLQGVRDNPRRMNSLGYNVVLHRVMAYAVSGVIAGLGGVLLVWYNGLITPNSMNTGWLINILVIAILGGIKHPIGPFIGAIIFVLLQTFAIDVISRERFNLVVGVVFLAIVLFSPDGIVGLWSKLRSRFGVKPSIESSHQRRQE